MPSIHRGRTPTSPSDDCQRTDCKYYQAGWLRNRRALDRAGAAATGDLAVVGAPAVEIGLGDCMVTVAVGGQRVAGLGERFSPEDVVGCVDDSIEVVVAEHAADGERAGRIELAG